MPDGANVSFPDDMPPEQIHDMIRKKFPNMDFSPPDPSYLAGAGRAVRGFASGVETTIDKLAPRFLQHDPKLTEKVLAGRTPPKDDIEGAANLAGEIAPSVLIPETGASATVGRAISLAYPRLATLAGAAAEGGVQGGLGGLMMSGDRSRNADVGTATGAALRGGGAAAQIALDAIPSKYKNLAAALAAGAAATKMGLPWWAVLMPHYWGQQGFQSMFRELYDANLGRLADLAGRGIRTGTREINPAVAGAMTAKGTSQESNDDR